jgi:hypothetical protein
VPGLKREIESYLSAHFFVYLCIYHMRRWNTPVYVLTYICGYILKLYAFLVYIFLCNASQPDGPKSNSGRQLISPRETRSYFICLCVSSIYLYISSIYLSIYLSIYIYVCIYIYIVNTSLKYLTSQAAARTKLALMDKRNAISISIYIYIYIDR